MKFVVLPIRILVIFLILLAIGACFSFAGGESASWMILARNVFFLAASSLSIYFVLQKLNLASPTLAEHRIITLLILFLLFDPGLPWWIFLALGATTELLQRLVRIASGPFFNPAALGGLVFSLFGFAPSWWGASYAPRLSFFGNDVSVAMFLTLLFAGYVAYRYRKLAIVVAALIAFTLAYFLLFSIVPLFIIVEGTLAFFLLVMAIEPKTSPIQRTEQCIFGSIIGVCIVLGLYVHFPEAYLGALLLANLYTRRSVLQGLVSRPQTQPVSEEIKPL